MYQLVWMGRCVGWCGWIGTFVYGWLSVWVGVDGLEFRLLWVGRWMGSMWRGRYLCVWMVKCMGWYGWVGVVGCGWVSVWVAVDG